MTAVGPLILEKRGPNRGLFVKAGSKRQRRSALVDAEDPAGHRVPRECVAVLPVETDAVGLDEVSDLILSNVILHVGQHQLARAVARQLAVEFQGGRGVVEILVGRCQEEV